ncbi:MAG: MmgE/PrpD family protein, partial [Actinobacteria bacterium]|nr:MmgE/PrpD family protein [Actinomycetota bacterium]
MHQAKRCLLDWLGVTLAGSRDPAASVLVTVAAELGPEGDTTMLGTGRRAGLLPAVLANGFMAHVLDFDDT